MKRLIDILGGRLVVAVVAVAASLFSSAECPAQRTMRGQGFVTAGAFHGVAPQSSSSVYGAGVRAGSYMLSSYWEAGLDVSPRTAPDSLGCVTISGGMMWRVAETRSRAFNLYGGADVFAGIDFTDFGGAAEGIVDDGKPTGQDSSGDGAAGFVYGLEPRLEAEVFVARRLAFVFSSQFPLKLRSRQDHVSARVGVGIRLCF